MLSLCLVLTQQDLTIADAFIGMCQSKYEKLHGLQDMSRVNLSTYYGFTCMKFNEVILD